MSEVTERGIAAEGQTEALVAAALKEAKRLGATQAEVAISRDSGLSATARLGEVENLEYTNDHGMGITVYRDHRKGSASTSDLSPAAINEAVAKACTFAEHTAADEFAGLADADRLCTDILDLDLEHAWSITADEAIQLAISCEAAAMAADARIRNSEGATVSSSRGVRAYGNSNGFFGEFAKTSHSISCVVLGEQDGDMQRDYYYTAARDPGELEDPDAIGLTAAQRAVSRLGARKLKTRKAPVVFRAELARGFVGHAIGAISGGAQYRKSSFLLDALGEQVFPAWVDIDERPHIPKGLASTPYDAEGVATYDRSIVAAGKIDGYVLSSYSARRLGMESTASAGGSQNLIVSANDADLQSLVERMGTGLIVEELIGQGVNGVTGDYSRGAVGHWVENGEIAYPVHEITIAGNLRDLYGAIVAIGEDRDLRGGIRCGSLLIGEMTIAGS
ncbi:MAG: metalloprotease PmbA [Woeseiaceae bacterium]|nr:metalloprotease PmbA [Woeseiaceae bacterium]